MERDKFLAEWKFMRAELPGMVEWKSGEGHPEVQGISARTRIARVVLCS